MTKTATTSKHQAVCMTCYTCVIHTGTKRDCNRIATGHMAAYGHAVTILPTTKAVR